MKRTIRPRERMLFYIAFIAGFLYISIVYVVQPLVRQWQNTSTLIMHTQIQLLKGQNKIRNKERIEKALKRTLRKIEIKGSYEDELGKAQHEILSLAKKNGVSITDIKGASVKDTDFYKTCSIQLNCEGTVKTITPFIWALEQSPQILRIQQMNLAATSYDSTQVKCFLLITKMLIAE